MFSRFLVVLASKTFTVSLDKSDAKNNFVKYFWRKSFREFHASNTVLF